MFLEDIERIHEYCNDIVCIYSDNDPYVDFKYEEEFANKVATKKEIIKGAGHINSESGYNKFEGILKYII